VPQCPIAGDATGSNSLTYTKYFCEEFKVMREIPICLIFKVKRNRLNGVAAIRVFFWHKIVQQKLRKTIGVDLAGLLGGRMASAEGGSVSSGVAYGEGCPLSSRLRGLGERGELPQRGTGRSPGRKRDFGVF